MNKNVFKEIRIPFTFSINPPWASDILCTFLGQPGSFTSTTNLFIVLGFRKI